jgi:hypothetical protein
MNKHVSSRLEMGARALEFSRAHPVKSDGYATALKQLEDLVVRGRQLAKEQESGITEVRAATDRRKRLKRSIRRSLLVHLARVAERATKEDPGLAQKFDLTRIPFRSLGFSTIARTMLEQARQQQELLVKHGLVAETLDTFTEQLDKFDQAVESGAEGRRIHIGAGANLLAITDEVMQIVRILDGYNRHRFSGEPDLLAAWNAASNVIGPAVSGAQSVSPSGSQSSSPTSPAAGGDIKPAA